MKCRLTWMSYSPRNYNRVTVPSRHALRSEWPFIIIIITVPSIVNPCKHPYSIPTHGGLTWLLSLSCLPLTLIQESLSATTKTTSPPTPGLSVVHQPL